MKKLSFLVLFLVVFGPPCFGFYPPHWWTEIPRENIPSWEILPHEAKDGEVILSKRTELGVFSNLANTPFTYDRVLFQSVEGFWQMMKYPENTEDPRSKLPYDKTRKDVASLHGFTAKKAGTLANKIMLDHHIDWISYQGRRFNYKDLAEGSAFHYQLIYNAIKAKIDQNPKLKKLLKQTDGLVLRPDHYQSENLPKSYYYHQILMDIRDLL